MNNQRISFEDYLETAFSNGAFSTDDVIAFALDACNELISLHEQQLVIPFQFANALFVVNNQLDLDENLAIAQQKNTEAISTLFKPFESSHFEIVDKLKLEVDADQGFDSYKAENVYLGEDTALASPAYMKGYQCFEVHFKLHDPQTDIFSLGLVLGSICLGFNLYDEEDVKNFVSCRKNISQYNKKIHPSVAALIREMTELDRRKRTQDLYDIVQRLLHYRDYDIEKQTDLSQLAGWVNQEVNDSKQFILSKLRNRLFDTSRRNRLLFYKSNARFVNLTISSVPTVLHYQSIRPEFLFTWNNEIENKVKSAQEISLNKYLRFDDHKYLPSSLDKIRVESLRDIQEFGFSQLKLVITFLNWNNFKEDLNERIQSPLLLIPVELKKTKRVKEDIYSLHILDNAAEVNPIVANQLRELYGIQTPDFVDLDDMSIQQFYEILKKQIEGASQGIQLNLISKPRIKLIHSIAKQTIHNYKRKLRKNGHQYESYKNIDYSYKREFYKPLGLEIFKQRIEPRASFLEFLVDEKIGVKSNSLTSKDTNERSLYQISNDEENPYQWEFDLCNMVLGNFNYKKMSLVRDYNQIIDTKIQHSVFDKLFSSQPRPHYPPAEPSQHPRNWYHVVVADPTQTQAIQKAQSGESYIIQGPPGTGKSQTITNLIADFVARGKNVLFICEKRAALDVVVHRLKQCGLDELCCYIHDSQGDKREFIKNLKTTFEDYVKNPASLKQAEAERDALIRSIELQIEILQRFHQRNKYKDDEIGIEVRNLISRVIELKPNFSSLPAEEMEKVPSYSHWMKFHEVIESMSEALEESGADPYLASHPLRNLNDVLFKESDLLQQLNERILRLKQRIDQLRQTCSSISMPFDELNSLTKLSTLIQKASKLKFLAEYKCLDLLDTNHSTSKAFDKSISALKKLEKELKSVSDSNQNWLHKFSRIDTEQAIRIAEEHESSMLKFLSGEWRRLKSQLDQSYHFEAHQVKPLASVVLKNLLNEHHLVEEIEKEKSNIESNYHIHPESESYSQLLDLRMNRNEFASFISIENGNDLVLKLCSMKSEVDDAIQLSSQILLDAEDMSLQSIQDELENIVLNKESIAELRHHLNSFSSLPEKLKKAMRNLELTPVQFETQMAEKSLQTILSDDRLFANTDFMQIQHAVKSIQASMKKLLVKNALLIRAKNKSVFKSNYDISNTSLSQLNPEQKAFKKTYTEGRKILENEFAKSMRFKSIRELSQKESGLVIKDIKPVWLMSPLSVSDCLPLQTDLFDVVIFDEASQITLEEGIPALYRSGQVVIVGDEKQMPPTNFFTTRAEDPDDFVTTSEIEDEVLFNDADSILVQGARKLDSTMLSWHYRSQYETLISYSNHAFYGADLLTIPDKTIHHQSKPSIEVTESEEAVQNADTLFDRSISFHHLTKSIYEKRSNVKEAEYIAHLVRELLIRGVKDSIGIVAFSQEQQNTIENALSNLALSDAKFDALLEEAYNRVEHDQFVGLIIKNLENIQGDERDIIIMSICYGADGNKRMLMNFGPINKKGGEKRLNVIFSRAKKHMAIVTSIQHAQIKNEYNEGANYFKRFLHYAECVSTGNMETARLILDGLVVQKKDQVEKSSVEIVTDQLKTTFEKKGYYVDTGIGQSSFKCNLAIKKAKEDDEFLLAILVDDMNHYSNNNIVEQYAQRVQLLNIHGWKTFQVFAKDWLEQHEKIVAAIEKRIHEVEEEEIEEENEVIPQEEVQDKVEQPIQENVKEEKASTPVSEFNFAFERYEMVEGTSNKFWEVSTDDTKLYVRFGKIGTKGQTQLKTFESKERAEQEKEKLIREKLAKGYKRA